MRCTIIGSLLLAGCTLAHASDPMDLQVLGYVEYAEILEDPRLRMRARLDTGALTSSLNALNRKRFERDGEKWIRFDVIDPDDEDKLIRFERPIVRNIRVLRHDGDHQRRAVVEMRICVGGVSRRTQVSLIDRTELTFQLLIGRRFMENRILVDSSLRTTTDPRCETESNNGSNDDPDAEH